jgi:hypothetical protein
MFNNALFPLGTPICSICQRPVSLDNAKTDEQGDAIHEDCYLIKLGVAKQPNSSQRVQCIPSENLSAKAAP